MEVKSRQNVGNVMKYVLKVQQYILKHLLLKRIPIIYFWAGNICQLNHPTYIQLFKLKYTKNINFFGPMTLQKVLVMCVVCNLAWLLFPFILAICGHVCISLYQVFWHGMWIFCIHLPCIIYLYSLIMFFRANKPL